MESFVDKNCLIIGFGISGQGAYNTLKLQNANVFIYDDNNSSHKDVDAVFVQKLSKKIIKDMDLIILSPIIKLNNKINKVIKKYNIECFGELEFAYRLNKGNILAITGSNGKTTTCTLLKQLLDTLPNSAYLLGNIGKSFADNVLDIQEGDNVVLECSSFQLMQTTKFHPHISALLNLAPDHLDFHKTIDE